MSRSGRCRRTSRSGIVRSLDGTDHTRAVRPARTPHQTDDAARRAITWNSLQRMSGLLASWEGCPRPRVSVDAGAPEAKPRSAPRVVEVPRKSGRKEVEDLRVGPETSEQDRVREIERLANQQLAEFLAQQQAQSPARTPAGRLGFVVRDLRRRPGHAALRDGWDQGGQGDGCLPARLGGLGDRRSVCLWA